MKKVNRLLRRTTQKEKLRVPGLDPRRRDIAVPGGILLAWILQRTGADGIVVGERGLREGIILDYAARHGQKRARRPGRPGPERGPAAARAANAEVLHATHVARLALELFDQTHATSPADGGRARVAPVRRAPARRRLLDRVSRAPAAFLLLITHGDLTGFSAEEIEVIASVARYHKGRARRTSHENWKRLDPYLRPVVEKLAAILRIADGLDRSHRQLVTDVVCRVRPRRVELDASRAATARRSSRPRTARRDLFERVFDREPVFRAVPAGRDETGPSARPRDDLVRGAL